MSTVEQTQSLQVLLQHAQQQRDQAQTALVRAVEMAKGAREQHAQLQHYRAEYQLRWSSQFAKGGTMEILMHYRSFMQRLDQAVSLQSRQADLAESHREQARAELLESERRVASVRKLLERRAAERAMSQRQHEQKQSDEQAQRMRWRAAQVDARNTQ